MPSAALNFVELTRSGANLSSRRAVLCVLLISSAVFVPTFLLGVPLNVDLLNHFRFALPFADGVMAGNYYPGWLAESNHGFGDPSFRFYPPGLYYLLTGATVISGNWYSGAIITFLLLSVVGALGVYFWARNFLDPTASMLASAFFAVAPYHLYEYQVSLLAEYAGCAVLPFVFGFAERIRDGGNRRSVAGLGAAYALLLLTHLPLTVIASTALISFVVARPQTNTRIKTLLCFGLGVGSGLAASAVYWMTVLNELDWVKLNKNQTDALVDYERNFLFTSFSPENLSVWWMNIIALLTLLLFVPAVLLRLKHTNSALRTAMALALGSLVMALPISWPIWRLLPPMQQIQFPWRWLAVLSVSGAVLAGAGLTRIRRITSTRRLLVVGAVLISLTFSFAHIVRDAAYLTAAEFQHQLATVRGTSSVDYWIPVWSNGSPRQLHTNVEAAGRSVIVERWDPEDRRFTVAAGNPTLARIKTFYYPHWKAVVGNQQLTVRPDADGTLLVSLPADPVTVDLTFREPPLSSYGGWVSGVGCSLLFILMVPRPRKKVHLA